MGGEADFERRVLEEWVVRHQKRTLAVRHRVST